MLRIEKLFLQGFKSFCDPTELVFDTEGITAVVGPNGCGKSNVADALSWVIGEQRAKALRGGKMEDVIFQGSRNRPPSGLAEVVLTLVVQETFEITPTEPAPDNLPENQEAEPDHAATPATEAIAESASDAASESAPADAAPPSGKHRPRRKAPSNAARIFHEGERITIARRLYRTGESEYEMNGRACRLRDIQDLFAGTGLGSAHYAIIEQGRIGQVLSAKPLDRRALIEEAAGVSKFKLRQRAAELKLEATKQNLARVTDIIAEVERQQAGLKRQAARANRFRRLREEMRQLQRAVFAADYRTTRDALSRIEQARAAVAAHESGLLHRSADAEAAHAEAARWAEEAEARLNLARSDMSDTGLALERSRQQLAHATQQIQNLHHRAAQQSRDRAAIDERSQFVRQELDRLHNALAQLEAQINSEAASLAEAEQEHRVAAAREAEAEREVATAAQQLTEGATRRERWRQLRRQFTDALERCDRQLQALRAEHERARATAESAAHEHAEITARLADMESARLRLAARLAATNRALDDRRRTAAEIEIELRRQHRDRTAVEQRLRSLVELDERHAHFSEAVQTLINHARATPDHPPFHVLGALADFIHVAPEHEPMVEAGLREELQYLLVPSYDDALNAIAFLKSRGQGRATFLVTGLGGASEPALVTDAASALGTAEVAAQTADSADTMQAATRPDRLLPLLGLSPEFTSLLAKALPGLATITVVSNLDAAVAASVQANGHGASTSFITPCGERIVGGSLLSGGSAGGQGQGILALKREIQELRQQLAQLTAGEQRLEDDLRTAQSAVAKTAEHRAALDDELRALDQQIAVQRQQQQQCERERERTAVHLSVVEREMAQAAEERTDFEGKLRRAETETEQAELAQAAAEEVARERQAALAELRRASAEGLEDLSRRRADFAAKSERRRALQAEIRRLEGEAQELARRLDRNRFEVVEADEQARQLAAERERLGAEVESLSACFADRQSQVETLGRELAAGRERLHAIDLELKRLREETAAARDERAALDVERARLSTGLEHIAATCQSELGESIAELCELLEQVTTSTTAEALDALTTQLAEGDDESEEFTTERLDIRLPGNALRAWTLPDGFDLAAAKERLEVLRAKIDALGPVNLMAIDELIEVEERLHFLVSQKADIDRAVSDTQAAIAEIKKRSRERFTEAFQIINHNFAEMFSELFGGGHGEMRLIDETDVLESGIDIIAQPPGKRLQNVLLLSGGEKAMAALALVLGIFKYRPSPFCLLDEVDAPLDEVNISRFISKVLEMSARTQFLVITHSKRTMEAAHTLYGVTMEDPGVSKLVSVRLT